MPVNTYAQNFEDVMLWRALSDVQQGFYIDIGAMDPDADSVSRLFHEKGWKGVHVDADPVYCERLRRERPGDVVIQAAVGESSGVVDFFVVEGTGISTAVEALALQHKAAGWPVQPPVQVPVVTLDGIFDNLRVSDIHWLKIDVEGFEPAVLNGWRLSPRRPWILVIEAIAPFSRVPIHETFEQSVLDKGYRFVYFDGINRYYVSEDHKELEAHFECGPMLWDEIKIPRHSPLASELVREQDHQAGLMRAEADELSAQLAEAQTMTAELHGQISLFTERTRHVEALSAELGAELAGVREEVSLQRAQREEVEALSIQLGKELAASEERNLHLREDVDRVMALLVQTEARAAELVAEWSKSESRNRGLHDRLEDLRTELAAAKAQIEVLTGVPPAQSLDELVAKGDREFLQTAYITLLGRPADPAGVQHYLGQLSAGVSRIAVLSTFLHSAEGRAFNPEIPGLHRLLSHGRFGRLRSIGRGRGWRLTRDRGAGVPAAAKLTSVEQGREMFLLNSRDFIIRAYQTVLRRDPDQTGESHFLERLANGEDRIDILAAIRWSDEGRALREVAPVIGFATNWYRWRRFSPLARWLRRRAAAKYLPTEAERLTRVMEGLNRVEGDDIHRSVDRAIALQSRLNHIDRSFRDGVPILPTFPPVDGGDEMKREAGGDDDDHFEDIVAWQAHPEERLEMALVAIRTLLPQYSGIEGGVENIAIVCSSDIPSGSELRWPTIWYAVGTDFSELGTLPEIPPEIALIATETREDAKRAVDLGIGIAAVEVGRRDVSFAEDEAGWERVAARLSACVNAIQESGAKWQTIDGDRPLRLAVVTTWNERCGIFTHSAELAGAFSEADVRIYAPIGRTTVAADKSNVYRLWRLGKEQNGFAGIVDHLRGVPADLLIVQFNYDFYNHEELNWFMTAASDLGVMVMVILHSTGNEGKLPNTRIVDFKQGLERCGRAIVHSQVDVERMANYGIKENVLLMPHGVKVRRKSEWSPIQRKVPVLATFGFCFTNKGLAEFITAIGVLRDRGVDVNVRMLNSLHDSQDSHQALAVMRDKVRQLNLSDRIKIVSNFLELEKVEHLISDVDLFVNSYKFTGESASGSVRLGLRMGLPTLVTPLPIFDDLGDAVFRTPGFTPEDIAQGIEVALLQLRGQGAEVFRMRAALDEWLSTHDFNMQAVRLGKIHEAIRAQRIVQEAIQAL